jgi:HK97 gp10 family phage protein
MARPNNSAAIAGHVQGLREAKRAFQALPEIVRDRMLVATETTVREIARGAQSRLRSSPAIRTRALHDHVAWSISKSNGRGKVGIKTGSTVLNIGGRRVRVKGVITAGAGGSASTAQGARKINPTRYAHFIEFGSKRQPAEPFMIPATEAEKDPYLARARKAGAGIEQDMARIGSRTL